MDPAAVPGPPVMHVSGKNKNMLLLLSWLLGPLGVDRFYRGQIGLGIVKLLTFGGCGVWALIDTLIYLLGELPKDSDGRVIADPKTMELYQGRVRLVDQFGADVTR